MVSPTFNPQKLGKNNVERKPKGNFIVTNCQNTEGSLFSKINSQTIMYLYLRPENGTQNAQLKTQNFFYHSSLRKYETVSRPIKTRP